jgi:hypothetical protein
MAERLDEEPFAWVHNRPVMTEHFAEELFAWVNQVLQVVLQDNWRSPQDEELVVRLVERGHLWLEWNPTDKNYVAWMRKPVVLDGKPVAKLGVFPIPIEPSRFGGNIGLAHFPDDFLANLGRKQTS